MSLLLVRRHRDYEAYVVGMHSHRRMQTGTEKKKSHKKILMRCLRSPKIVVLFLMIQNWMNGSRDWQETVKMKRKRGHLGRKTIAVISPTTVMGSSKLLEMERVQADKEI